MQITIDAADIADRKDAAQRFRQDRCCRTWRSGVMRVSFPRTLYRRAAELGWLSQGYPRPGGRLHLGAAQRTGITALARATRAAAG